MSTELIRPDEVVQLPAVRERSSVLLAPVMDVSTATKRLQEFQAFCASYLKEGIDEDYGTIPGTKKKALLKPGADKLAEIYGLADEYQIVSEVENWDTGLFDYKVKCVLTSRRDDSFVGTGLGSCSSYESKYRWRDAQKKCPQCGAESIIKGKAEFGGGWLCWTKKSGCGAKFKDGDESIEKQVSGRVENPDIIDTKNTVLKMAKKRAKIDAIIGVTRSSGIFTQDMEDISIVVTKEPEKTTETYTRSAASNPAQGEVVDVKGHKPKPEAAEPALSMKFRKEIHAMFRKTIPEARKLEADNYFYDWLLKNGYHKNGEPSTSCIPEEKYGEVLKAALAYAASL